MLQPWDSQDSGVIWSGIWEGLGVALRSPGHPWRTPVLTTAGDEGGGRVIVLRGASELSRELEFHTDIRSSKVEALRVSPRAGWVFYSAEWQVQLRVRARARLHVGDSVSSEAWDRVPEASRTSYSASQAPGTPVPHPYQGQYLQKTGRDNFAVVCTVVETLDWLWLNPSGHRRARWEWGGAGWSAEWLVP